MLSGPAKATVCYGHKPGLTARGRLNRPGVNQLSLRHGVLIYFPQVELVAIGILKMREVAGYVPLNRSLDPHARRAKETLHKFCVRSLID